MKRLVAEADIIHVVGFDGLVYGRIELFQYGYIFFFYIR